MRYLEIELERLTKVDELSIDEEIKFNILNFIRTIHLNEQNSIEESYNT